MGWPRTKYVRRRDSKFAKKTFAQHRDFLVAELVRLGASRVVLSTDIPVRQDGLPYARGPQPNDPGAAVYFQWLGNPHVLACDTYHRTWENMQAVGKTIEAIRAIQRHGASQLLKRAVAGFRALGAGESPPEPEEPSRPWWEVIGVGVVDGISPIQIAGDPNHPMRSPLLKLAEAVYKVKAIDAHPDRGGSSEAMLELNRAIEQARKALE